MRIFIIRRILQLKYWLLNFIFKYTLNKELKYSFTCWPRWDGKNWVVCKLGEWENVNPPPYIYDSSTKTYYRIPGSNIGRHLERDTMELTCFDCGKKEVVELPCDYTWICQECKEIRNITL